MAKTHSFAVTGPIDELEVGVRRDAVQHALRHTLEERIGERGDAVADRAGFRLGRAKPGSEADCGSGDAAHDTDDHVSSCPGRYARPLVDAYC